MITITAAAPLQPIKPFDDTAVYVRATPPALERAVISLQFPGRGVTELVWDGAAFMPPYQNSLQSPYSDAFGTGFEWTVRREHGWPDGFIVKVVAYDVAGGEAILG